MRHIKLAIVYFMLAALCIPLTAQDNDPAATVRAFLDGWNAKDTASMWGTLTIQSQDEYPQQVFTNRYTVANDAMGFESLTYTIRDTKIQGVTAAVHYDVVITSGMFGQLDDPDRTMRLVNTNGRWGVAWSSMDIFAELPSVGQLTSAGQLAARARIYDRDGEVIAGTGNVMALYTARQNIPNEDSCKSLLSNVTRRPYVAFDRQFALYNSESVFFISEITEEDFRARESQLVSQCAVVAYQRSARRVYFGNNVMSHVVGYLGQMSPEQEATYLPRGYSTGDVIGQGGVERMYETTLAGTPDRVLRITEPGGTVLREFATSGGTLPNPIQMTIDRDLQRATAQAIFDAYDYAYPNWGNPEISYEGAAVVLDVNTGAVLAMASFPLFDPLLFDPDAFEPRRRVELLGQVNNDSRRPLINHAIQDRYTPGSVYKLITAYAGLSEDIFNPEDIFSCGLTWDGRPFGDDQNSRSDWRLTDGMDPAGEITPAQAIMSSCNPFFYETGAKLYNAKRDVQAQYARMLGLGESYNIYGGTLPEASADLGNPQFTSAAIMTAVGQYNVTIPPIQMAVATATIANGGTAYKPYIVQQIGGFDGTQIAQTFTPQILHDNEFAPGVLESLQTGMCGTTTDERLGTAYERFRNAPYSVCGKTGSAQTGRYPHAWFVAYAPADNPQIAVAVVVTQSLEGSQVAAPIARRIFDFYFSAPNTHPYPEWWAVGPYVPLNIPEGSTGG